MDKPQTDGYNLMPVVVEGDALGDLMEEDQIEMDGTISQHRLVDFLGQDGVNLGQTIVLIQVPRDSRDILDENKEENAC